MQWNDEPLQRRSSRVFAPGFPLNFILDENYEGREMRRALSLKYGLIDELLRVGFTCAKLRSGSLLFRGMDF